MVTRTTTKVSHYHVQKERRGQFLADWRRHRRTVVHGDDVVLTAKARGVRSGVYMGSGGERPTRVIDAWVHEVDPHTRSTVHRHSWDALMLCVGGSGWTEIDGRRIVWRAGDALHRPAWSWHRQGNDGEQLARYLTFSSEPLLATMNLSVARARRPAAWRTRRLPGWGPQVTPQRSTSTRTICPASCFALLVLGHGRSLAHHGARRAPRRAGGGHHQLPRGAR
jgi:gentisate 1,2-dioxygenase